MQMKLLGITSVDLDIIDKRLSRFLCGRDTGEISSIVIQYISSS
jgi:hypothetical protein